jgi:hypothetical protein
MQRAQLEMVNAQAVRSCAEKRRCISLNLLWPDGHIRAGGDSFTRVVGGTPPHEPFRFLRGPAVVPFPRERAISTLPRGIG